MTGMAEELIQVRGMERQDGRVQCVVLDWILLLPRTFGDH